MHNNRAMGQFLNRMQIYITPVNGLLFHATVIPDLDLAFFLKGLVNLDENKDLIRFFFFFYFAVWKWNHFHSHAGQNTDLSFFLFSIKYLQPHFQNIETTYLIHNNNNNKNSLSEVETEKCYCSWKMICLIWIWCSETLCLDIERTFCWPGQIDGLQLQEVTWAVC